MFYRAWKSKASYYGSVCYSMNINQQLSRTINQSCKNWINLKSPNRLNSEIFNALRKNYTMISSQLQWFAIYIGSKILTWHKDKKKIVAYDCHTMWDIIFFFPSNFSTNFHPFAATTITSLRLATLEALGIKWWWLT